MPRFSKGRRALLRDLHAVPAVWLSLLILFLLATGIQWTSIGGAWTSYLARSIGEWQPETVASAHRSEILGGWSPFLRDKAMAQQVAEVASAPANDVDSHAEHRASAAAAETSPAAGRKNSNRTGHGHRPRATGHR